MRSSGRIVAEILHRGMPEVLSGPPSHSDMHNAMGQLLGIPTVIDGSMGYNAIGHLLEHVLLGSELHAFAAEFGVALPAMPELPSSLDAAFWQGHGDHHEWQAHAIAAILGST